MQPGGAAFTPETAAAVWAKTLSRWELRSLHDCTGCHKEIVERNMRLRPTSFLSRTVCLVSSLKRSYSSTVQRECLAFIDICGFFNPIGFVHICMCWDSEKLSRSNQRLLNEGSGLFLTQGIHSDR